MVNPLLGILAFVLDTSAGAGVNVFGCVGVNTWALQSGGGGQGTVTVSTEGTPIGTRGVVNFIAGTGVLNAFTDTGSQINLQQGSDTSVLLTRSTEQSGSDLLCNSASGSPSDYTCALSPSLRIYTPNMVLHWRPDLSGSGGATTLNVDTLGAVAVKQFDGTTNPTAADIVANRLYSLWHDGAVFRLIVPGVNVAVTAAQSGSELLCNSASGSASAYTCALSPPLPVYTPNMVLHWRPDISGAGGSTTLNVDTLGAVAVKQFDGTTNPANNDIVANRLYALWYDGAAFRLMVPGGNVAALAAQSGSELLCSSASGSASAYTCALSPSLPVYTPNMVLHWQPDISGAGGATTLNVDTLGAVPVKQFDGTTDPTAADIMANRLYPLWHDGAMFRLMIPPVNVATTATRPTCIAAQRGRIWQTLGTATVKDQVSVCAKDASEAYAWRTLY